MPRPRKDRFVAFEPNVTYFKPRGVPLSKLEEEILSVEELEALRLEFLEKLDYSDSAEKMNVSRATFSRMLHKAGEKVAIALSQGKSLKIAGGNYIKKEEIKMPFGRGRGQGTGAGRGRNQGFGLGPGGNCVCPSCGATATRFMAPSRRTT